MRKQSLLASAVAAAIAGVAQPAAAIISVDLGAITDVLDVASDTAAYDTWASTCPNVSAGGGACGDAGGATDSDATLFFWDREGDADNSRIEITWTGTDPSEVIRSVRITTTGTTPLGAADGPLPVKAVPDSVVPGDAFIATFNNSPRPGGGTFAQGQGLFAAYGRTVYDESGSDGDTDWEITRQAIYPFNADLAVGVDGPGGGGPTSEIVSGSSTAFFAFANVDNSPVDANLFPVDLTVALPGSDQGSLNNGDVLGIELFTVNTIGDPGVPGNVPVGYMDDIQIQLNPGPRLEATPADTASVEVRVGTALGSGPTTSITATNIGGDDGFGNADLNGQFEALTDNLDDRIRTLDAGPTLAFDLTPGDSQARFYEVDTAGIELDLDDVSGESFTALQEITVAADDYGGPQTRTVAGTVVGPILGVFGQPDPSTPAQTLDYGTTIDLGDLDIGESTASVLAIGNLFGADLGQLTDLTIRNAALDEAFDGRLSLLGVDGSGDCTLPNPYEDDGSPTVGAATGDLPDPFQLPDLCIAFAPGEYPGGGTPTGNPNEFLVTFDTTLRFFTDMNMAFGDIGDIGDPGEKAFGIELTAVYLDQPVPAPAPLALIGIGIAGLAGLRRVRRLGPAAQEGE